MGSAPTSTCIYLGMFIYVYRDGGTPMGTFVWVDINSNEDLLAQLCGLMATTEVFVKCFCQILGKKPTGGLSERLLSEAMAIVINHIGYSASHIHTRSLTI